ncbi:SprB repeat-containing protein, partial [Marivirga sp. S37H4]
MSHESYAQVNITTADLSNLCVDGGFYVLDDILITETTNADFATSGGSAVYLRLEVPANFEFRTGASSGNVLYSGGDITTNFFIKTTNYVEVEFVVNNTIASDQFIFRGFQVRAVTAGSSGNLTRIASPSGTDATINGDPIGANHGTYSSVESPTITTQPSSVIICENDITSFGVTATGSGLSYQWQRSDDNEFSFVNIDNFTDGGIYSNFNSPTLQINNTPLSTDTYDYRVIVSGICLPSVISNVVDLSINALPTTPTISSSGSTICNGTDPDVTLTSSPAPNSGSYVWYKNGIAIADVTQSIDLSDPAASGDYTVKVIDGSTNCESLLSNAETVEINALPNTGLTLNYDATTVCDGENITITVENSQSGINYHILDGAFSIISPVVAGTSANVDIETNALSPTINTLIVRATNVTTGCESDFTSQAITVNPLAVLNSSLTPAGICSESTFNYTPTSATAGTSFSWTREEIAGISEPNANGTGSISETLTNTTNSPINVTYSIITTVNGCDNAGENVVVNVNPMPTITATASDISCNAAGDGSVTGSSSGGTGTLVYDLEDDLGNAIANTTGDASGTYTALAAGTYRVRVTDDNGCTSTSNNVVVSEPAVLSASTTDSEYNGFDISCNGENDGYIEVTAVGGTGNYTFTLGGDAAATQTQPGTVYRFNNLSAGSYTIDLEDANNCSIVQQNVTLTEPVAITATAAITSNFNGAELSCFGASDGEITTTAGNGSGGYTYVLNEEPTNTTGDANGIYTGLAAGSYTV